MRRVRWPDWWDWDLHLSLHVRKRMSDRGFTELDLRLMLDHAHGLRRDVVEERWAIDARLRGRQWVVIVEPDAATRRLVVVTAYCVGRTRA